ncbi:MAG: hypothetical protein EBV98_00435, partial [Actinobacteria bacterium]|nr:hypothetical protein [Actinomycetota bacterium]
MVGCTAAEPVETATVPSETSPQATIEAAEIIEVAIPDEPENSDHGYRNLDPDRIPSFGKCETFLGWWRRGPVAVSFEARDALGLEDIAVSTQIYLKNQELDEDFDGVICADLQTVTAGDQPGNENAPSVDAADSQQDLTTDATSSEAEPTQQAPEIQLISSNPPSPSSVEMCK